MFSRISKLFIVCIMLIVIGAVHQVEAGTWTQKADMPTARDNAGSAVVDGKIYVIGGAPVPYGFTSVVEKYDTATDAWTTRVANMPTTRQGVRAAAVDGIIYAIGGWKPGGDTSILEAYDPATDKWTRKANMPTRRTMTAVAVVDGIIYVIGGELGITPLSVVEAYNPATNKWTRMADMPTARFQPGVCVIDGRIYVSGGCPRRMQDGIWPCVPTVEVYDPATDTWIQVSPMPWCRRTHCASAVGGKMYIIGGMDEEMVKLWREGKIEEDEMAESFKVVYVYDPATDMWTTSADRLPTPRVLLTAAVVNGKIYAIGGGRGDPYELASTVEEYDPGLPGASSSVSPGGKASIYWGQIKSDK
jgi:N-acetylneuraminic acid mutarotase